MKYYILFTVSILIMIFAFLFFFQTIKQHDEIERGKIHTTKENMIYMAAWMVALPNVFMSFILAIYAFYKIAYPVLRKISL